MHAYATVYQANLPLKLLRFPLLFGAAAILFLLLSPLSTAVLAKTNEEAHAPWAQMRFIRLLHYQDERQPPVQTVHDMLQDKFGFMWFAGEHGLSRYDGHRLVHYVYSRDDPHSLPNNTVPAITTDNNGRLWVGTESGLSYFDRHNERFVNLKDSQLCKGRVCASAIRDLHVDHNNRLMVASDNGFAIINAERTNSIEYTYRAVGAYRIPRAPVKTLTVAPDQSIWLGTIGAGVLHIPAIGQPATQYVNKLGDKTSLTHNHVTHLLRDHKGRLWVSTQGGGLSRMDNNDGVFKRYQFEPNNPFSLGNNSVWQTYQDAYFHIWVATDHGGLNYYDEQSDQFKRIKHDPYDNQSLLSDNIRTIFEDRVGNLWVGTYPYGLSLFQRQHHAITHATHKLNQPDSLSHSGVLTIIESISGDLLIGTESGLNRMDPATLSAERLLADPDRQDYLQFDTILSLQEDPQGGLWIGTWSDGLYYQKPNSQQFVHYKAQIVGEQQKHGTSINSDYIWSLVLDGDTLWIATETGGLNRLDIPSKSFTYFRSGSGEHQLSHEFVRTLYREQSGNLWVGTANGLSYFNTQSQTFKRYSYDPNNANSLAGHRIFSIFEDSQSRLWIGTQGAGISILDADRENFTNITVADGLPSNTIPSIIADSQGYIWATSDDGIARINPDTLDIQRVKKSTGLISDSFKRNASFLGKDGKLYIGSTEGINIFNPKEISLKPRQHHTVITDFIVFNQNSDGQAVDNSPLEKAIYDTSHLVLPHDEPVIGFQFSAMEYAAPSRIQYQYQLEGYDKQWRDASISQTAYFSHLPPGKYTFKVRASNTLGEWPENSTQLAITRLAPPWQQWWAYLFYCVVSVLTLYFIWRSYARRIELQKERTLNAKLIQFDQMKDTFLANTSHELRTPLNGIIGLSETLQTSLQAQLSKEQAHSFDMIIQSGRRLAHLINDILDMSKLGKQSLKLNCQALELAPLIDTVLTLASPLVGQKELRLINAVDSSTPAVFADNNRLQQILLNLVSNAIKYSSNGNITLKATHTRSWVTVHVYDMGLGISEDQQAAIFDSFIQAHDGDARHFEGTGLGLSITKQLVELHGGSIHVDSELDKGSHFWFTLKAAAPNAIVQPANALENPESKTATLDPHALQPTINESAAAEGSNIGGVAGSNARTNDQPPKIQAASTTQEKAPKTSISAPSFAKHITILCVDDNAVNRMVLRGILSLHGYNILEAESGKQALDIIQSGKQRIHLVLLDVMMPNMTGYEMCTQLRKQHTLASLPVIFLTAKDKEKELAQSYACGGNDFVSKPVNKDELLARVKMLLSLLHGKTN